MKEQISFFVMTYKGWSVLQQVLEHYQPLVGAVVAARDQGVQNDYYEQIKALCRNYQIPFFDRKEAPTLTTSYIIAISWRWMIPAAQAKVIVLHDSLLPHYRGFNPLVSALINGDEVIGVTALWANEHYDRGDIIAQAKIKVHYPVTIQQAIEKITSLYQELVLRICQQIEEGQLLLGTPQDETLATYSLWRDTQDYFINWQNDSQQIKRFIDAVGYPYDGAKAYINGQQLVTIMEAEWAKDVTIFDRNNQIGKVIFLREGQPVVVCGKGLLQIKKMIDELGNSLTIKKFRTRFTSSQNVI